MNPFKRIKIGDRILTMDCIVCFQVNRKSVHVGMSFDDEPSVFEGKEATLLLNHFEGQDRFIQARKGFFINVDAITSVSLQMGDDVLVWVAHEFVEPYHLKGDDAQRFWEQYSERTDCLDLSILNKKSADRS